jgi:hypothetical protein
VPHRTQCICQKFNIINLSTLCLKQCLCIEVRPHMCGDSRPGDLCCVGFINPISVAGVGRHILAISIGPN